MTKLHRQVEILHLPNVPSVAPIANPSKLFTLRNIVALLIDPAKSRTLLGTLDARLFVGTHAAKGTNSNRGGYLSGPAVRRNEDVLPCDFNAISFS